MGEYIYRARSAGGALHKGRVVAGSPAQAALLLRQHGYYPVLIQPVEGRSTFLSHRELVWLARQLNLLLAAGVPLLAALRLIAFNTATGRNLRRVAFQLLAGVESGRELSEAAALCRPTFPSLFINLLRAGELTGRLEEVLAQAADHYERMANTRTHLQSALLYPFFILVFTLVLGIFIMAVVAPQLTMALQVLNTSVPLSLHLISHAGLLLREWWPILLAVVLAGMVLLCFLFRPSKRYHRLLTIIIRIPLVGKFLTRVAVARATSELAVALAAGIPLVKALNMAADVAGDNPVGAALARLANGVEKGQSLSGLMEQEKVLPPLFPVMVRVGEESGEMEEVLKRLAIYLEEDLLVLLKGVLRLAEPVAVLLVGCLVGLLVLAVFVPMLTSLSNLNLW